MAHADIPSTRMTLLDRLVDPADNVAWERFVQGYGTVLRRWCRNWELQEADVEDVVQNILLELCTHIRRYAPTGRFRSWLKTVARRAWYDFKVKRQVRDQGTGDSHVLRLLHSVEAEEEFLHELEAEAEAELVTLAMTRVRALVSANTWSAFDLHTLKKQSGEEVGRTLAMTVGSVYVACCKVKKLLREQMEAFNALDGG